MIATRRNFDDLIGLPYLRCGDDPAEGIDCLWCVRQVCERIFADFDARELPVTGYEIEAAIAADGEFGARWKKIPWCANLGDMVKGTLADEPFVGILIDPVGRGVLTAKAHGGSMRVPFRSMMGVESIWRRGPLR